MEIKNVNHTKCIITKCLSNLSVINMIAMVNLILTDNTFANFIREMRNEN